MAIDRKTERELTKFIKNLRDSREEAIQQLAASEQRIRDLQGALSDYEDQKKARGIEEVEDSDTVEYTYKPGDTFGQVITDLGLKTDKGLWGNDGDVKFYTDQLIEQGALNQSGNIPIGTTIKLRRRGSDGGTITGSNSNEKMRIDMIDDMDRAEEERAKAKAELEKVDIKTRETQKSLREAAKKEEKSKALESAALMQAIRNALKK